MSSSVISPSLSLALSLPNAPLCPSHSCVCILGGLQRGMREGSSMYTHKFTQSKSDAVQWQYLSNSWNATALSHFFPLFSLTFSVPPDQFLLFLMGQGQPLEPGQAALLERTLWELTCGFWLRNDCFLSMNAGDQGRLK